MRSSPSRLVDSRFVDFDLNHVTNIEIMSFRPALLITLLIGKLMPSSVKDFNHVLSNEAFPKKYALPVNSSLRILRLRRLQLKVQLAVSQSGFIISVAMRSLAYATL